MAIPEMGLKVAGGVGATAAVVTPTALGIAYKDEISNYMKGEAKAPAVKEEWETLNESLETLGIPNECRFSKEQKESKTCGDLAFSKLGSIKFSEKGDGNLSMAESDKVTLKMEKISGQSDQFPENLKFTFTTDKDLSFGNKEPKIALKKGLDNVFKVKSKTENELEEVWGIKKLGSMIDLECEKTTNDKSCTLKSGGKINVLENNNKKKSGATINAEKKINFEGGQSGHNKGFKFTVAEDVDLSGGTGDSNVTKILSTSGVSYEIKFDTDK